jgi:hypothetical protein
MAKEDFEAKKITTMQDVGVDSSLIVHLIASNFGASDCLPEDLSDLVIKHLTTYHYHVYPSRLFSSFFGYRTGTEDHLDEIVGRFDDSPFQAVRCLQATWRALDDKNWANRTMNLGLSKRRRCT